MPKKIIFSNANTITYTYDGAGNKLSVAYTAGGTTVKTDYVGNKVYKNGTLSMLHTEEGYITFSGAAPTYHYYLKDHQGNNRVVMNQNGTVEQVNHYYPFGGLFGEGLQAVNQPYKYNGKELDRFEGLDMYDYGARHYDAAVGRWFTVDPHAEKYPSISSYVYVANNPIMFIDPDGRDIVLPKGTSIKNTYTILGNLQKLSNDKLVYSTQKDGSIRIKIASLGEGNKTAGTRLIRRLNSSDKVTTIEIGTGGNSARPDSRMSSGKTDWTKSKDGTGDNVTVKFDPSSNPSISTIDPKTGDVSGKSRPNQVGLAHELIHADHITSGEVDLSNEELRTVGLQDVKKGDITENQIRKEQKQNQRGAY